MALSRWGVWGSGLSPSCCLSYLVHRSWPGLLRCQASAHSPPSVEIVAEWGLVCSAPLFHIQLSEFRAKAGSSYQLPPHPDHSGTLGIKSLLDRGQGGMGEGSVCGSFYLRPHHEVFICSRGHYCDRLFTITDRLGLLKDLCYSFS